MARKLNWATIVLDLIYIALGIIFIIRPDGVESVLCYILALAIAIIGLLYIGGYFIQKPDEEGKREGNGFVFGILLIILAVFIVVKQNLVISLVPFLFGVMVLIRGLMIVQHIFHVRRMGLGAPVPVGVGLITMALGLFIMLFPFETMSALFVLIGISLMFAGVAGIVWEIMMWSAARKIEHEVERARDMEGVHKIRKIKAREDSEDAELLVEDAEFAEERD